MDLRIPKREVVVEILYKTSIDHIDEYVLYLNKYSKCRKGEEDLDEFLNKNKKFIPAKKKVNNELNIISLNNIIYVKEKEKTDEEGKKKLIIHFSKELIIYVELFGILPKYHSRPIDYFNTDTNFLSFLKDGSKIFINKNNITRITDI